MDVPLPAIHEREEFCNAHAQIRIIILRAGWANLTEPRLKTIPTLQGILCVNAHYGTHVRAVGSAAGDRC